MESVSSYTDQTPYSLYIPYVPTDRDVEVFHQCFVGRHDVYAKRVKSGGYIPIRHDLLRDSQPIRDHISGKILMGSYFLQRSGYTNTIGVDFDGKNGNPFEEMARLKDWLIDYQIFPLMNYSQSGKGCHLRVIFSDFHPASLLRDWMHRSIENAEVLHTSEGGTFDRIFPSQDRLSNNPNAIGNQLACPINAERAETTGGTRLIDPSTWKPIPFGKQTFDYLHRYADGCLVSSWRLHQMIHEMKDNGSWDKDDWSVGRNHYFTTLANLEDYTNMTGEMSASLGNAKEIPIELLSLTFQCCPTLRKTLENRLSYQSWVGTATNLLPLDNATVLNQKGNQLVRPGEKLFLSLSSLDVSKINGRQARYQKGKAQSMYHGLKTNDYHPMNCSTMMEGGGGNCECCGEDGRCTLFCTSREKGAKSPIAALRVIGNVLRRNDPDERANLGEKLLKQAAKVSDDARANECRPGTLHEYDGLFAFEKAKSIPILKYFYRPYEEPEYIQDLINRLFFEEDSGYASLKTSANSRELQESRNRRWQARKRNKDTLLEDGFKRREELKRRYAEIYKRAQESADKNIIQVIFNEQTLENALRPKKGEKNVDLHYESLLMASHCAVDEESTDTRDVSVKYYGTEDMSYAQLRDDLMALSRCTSKGKVNRGFDRIIKEYSADMPSEEIEVGATVEKSFEIANKKLRDKMFEVAKEILKKYKDDPSQEKSYLIKATPGLGKTYIAIKIITWLAEKGYHVGLCMPDRNMVYQAKQRIEEQYPYNYNITASFGRHEGFEINVKKTDGTFETVNISANCSECPQCEAAARKGLSPAQVVCPQCEKFPHFKDENGCTPSISQWCDYWVNDYRAKGWLTSELAEGKGRIVVCTHAKALHELAYSTGFSLDYLFIDEDMSKTALQSHWIHRKYFTGFTAGGARGELLSLLYGAAGLIDGIQKNSEKNLANFTALNSKNLRYIKKNIVIRSKDSDYEARRVTGKALVLLLIETQKQIWANGSDAYRLNYVKALLKRAIAERPKVEKGELLYMDQEEIDKVPDEKEYLLYGELLKVIDDYNNGRERTYSCSLQWRAQWEKDFSKRYCMPWRYKVHFVQRIDNKKGPAQIYLDAYGKEEIIQSLTGKMPVAYEVLCRASDNVHITHLDINTSQRALEKDLEKILKHGVYPHLCKSAFSGKKYLIVSNKRFEERIFNYINEQRWEEKFGIEFAFKYFYSGRGDDNYFDFSSVIILGSSYCNPAEMEDMANAIFYDQEPISTDMVIDKKTGLRRYKDERMQLMHESLELDEIMQMMFRHRPANKTGFASPRKDILIINNMGITGKVKKSLQGAHYKRQTTLNNYRVQRSRMENLKSVLRACVEKYDCLIPELSVLADWGVESTFRILENESVYLMNNFPYTTRMCRDQADIALTKNQYMTNLRKTFSEVKRQREYKNDGKSYFDDKGNYIPGDGRPMEEPLEENLTMIEGQMTLLCGDLLKALMLMRVIHLGMKDADHRTGENPEWFDKKEASKAVIEVCDLLKMTLCGENHYDPLVTWDRFFGAVRDEEGNMAKLPVGIRNCVVAGYNALYAELIKSKLSEKKRKRQLAQYLNYSYKMVSFAYESYTRMGLEIEYKTVLTHPIFKKIDVDKIDKENEFYNIEVFFKKIPPSEISWMTPQLKEMYDLINARRGFIAPRNITKIRYTFPKLPWKEPFKKEMEEQYDDLLNRAKKEVAEVDKMEWFAVEKPFKPLPEDYGGIFLFYNGLPFFDPWTEPIERS